MHKDFLVKLFLIGRYFLARLYHSPFEPAGLAHGPNPRAEPGPARAQDLKSRLRPGLEISARAHPC